MTSSDIRQQAEKLVAEEDRRNQQRVTKELEQSREPRIAQAIERIQKQRAKEQEGKRKAQAKAKADALGVRRAKLEDQADVVMDSLLGIIADLRLLDEEQTGHLRDADLYYTEVLGSGKRPRHESLDATLKKWLRAHLRGLVTSDAWENQTLEMHGWPEARPLSQIDSLAHTKPDKNAS